MKKLVNILFLFALSIPSLANAQDVEMADVLRTNGKIYAVVAILLIILIGLIVYLFIVDRKVSNLEKRLPDKK
jgi:amino acid permease